MSPMWPNGLVEEKSFYSGDDDDGMQVAVKKSADGQTIYSQKAFYFKDYGWSVGAVAVKETLGTDASGKRVTEWDYFLSGENKGKIREKRDWRGNRFVYDYDAKGRLTMPPSDTRRSIPMPPWTHRTSLANTRAWPRW